jgi:hypothetical protein
MVNELWAEVYTPAGVMQGIVDLVSASITKQMDAAGQISLVVPSAESNAVNLLQIWRRVKIYWGNPSRGKELVGSGVLLAPNINIGSNQTTWTGQDMLQELRCINTWRGLTYDNQTINDIVKDLISNVSGWSSFIDSGLGYTSRRFAGDSILRAILTVVQGAGVHLRMGQSDNRIEVGAFGADSKLRMTNLSTASHEARSNPELVMIHSLSVIEDGFEVLNVVEPLWGNGDVVLTLRRSTRTSPYTIQTMPGPDGRTIYQLKDTASIAQYGEVQGPLTMDDAPYIAADGGASSINAANVLYDWAAKKLPRVAQPKQTYQATGIKLDKPLRPGDKLRLVYQGSTYQYGIAVNWLDVDDLFWVLSMTENYSMQGQTISMQISNVDEPAVDAAGLIANNLIMQSTASIKPRLTSNQQSYSSTLTISPGAPDTLEFTIAAMTVDIGQAVLTLTRDDPSGPSEIWIAIDGLDYTVQLGGPWLVGAFDNDPVSLDIDEILQDGSVQGDHTIEISCLLRTGDIDVSVEVVEIGVSG